MKSVLLERLLKATPLGARGDYGYGLTGAYGERYEPESRQEFVDAYIDRVWTHRCVELIATSMTQVRMQVRVGKEWTDEHRLIELLQRPNPRDPAQMFFEWTTRWAEILGEWQWEIVPARDGGIAQLFPLRSHLVRIKPDNRGRVGGYLYDPHENGTEVIHFDAVDPERPARVRGKGGKPIVIAGRYANPRDDFYGMGPLRAAKDDIISEYYGVRYDHRFFRNSGRPDIVVGFKGKLDPDQRKENREEWQKFKGVDNAHRAAVMDGDPDVTKLSETQKDVEYLEGRRLSREGQCAAFGVQPVLVGDMTRATYSNFENAEPIFWKITMLPKLSFFATWTNFVLLPFFPDVEEFGFDTSEIPALARAEGWRSERIVGEIGGGVRAPNEGRDALGLDPIEDERANQLWLPTKLRPIGEDPQPPPPPGPPPEELPAAPKSLRGDIARREKQTVATWLRNALEAKQRFSERGVNEIAKHFGQQRDRVLAIIEGQAKAAELERLLREYGWSDDAAEFHTLVEAMQAGLAEVSFRLTEPTLDHTPSPGLLERVIRNVANRPDGIQSVGGRVKTDVLEQVRLGIEHGLTYRQIAEGGTFPSAIADADDVTLKGVKGVYEEYTTWQAERIARTEAGHTFNVASASLMSDAGIEHVDIVDGDEHEPCSEWNGSRRTLAEYEAEPLAHPNCTRIGLPVIDVKPAD